MVKSLIDLPQKYDIIISDFGRDATIEFLKQVSIKEKEVINKILKENNLPFFDEYRRIMFSVIADVAFYEEFEIIENYKKHNCITQDILIGIGGVIHMSQEFVNRISLTIILEILAAIKRGYSDFRIMIPCNTLSELTLQIGKLLCSKNELKRFINTFDLAEDNINAINDVNVSVYTVAESVMSYFSKTSDMEKEVLVLGTKITNKIYNELSKSYNVKILQLDEQEQNLVDEAIIASIGNDLTEVNKYIHLLQKNIIEPRKNSSGNLAVLEACTDFNLGLGLKSLEIFADVIVEDCYLPKK